MGDKFRVREALRSATADLHARVDDVFSAADLADPAGYRRFLLAQASAHISIETDLDRDGAQDVLDDWPARRRAHLIESDLAGLGVDPPAAVAPIDFANEAALLGGIYVLEGSRLGGALLGRSVPPSLPSSFLKAGDPAAWRRLLATLEEQLRDEADVDDAIVSARRVFMQFERSGQQFLKVD